MIAIDMRVDDAIASASNGRTELRLGGVETDSMGAVLKNVLTASQVRIIILEAGEEFPPLPNARKPYAGEGCDPFA